MARKPQDPEMAAMTTIIKALDGLQVSQRKRVLDYVSARTATQLTLSSTFTPNTTTAANPDLRVSTIT